MLWEDVGRRYPRTGLPNGTQPRMTLDKHLTLAEARTARSAKTPAGNSLFVRRSGR